MNKGLMFINKAIILRLLNAILLYSEFLFILTEEHFR